MIEGLEDKGLDAKSYIQQMLRRTDGSSREEQIIQKVIFSKDFYTFLLYYLKLKFMFSKKVTKID